MLNFSARLTEHCTRSKSARPGDRELFFSRPKLNVSRLRRPGAVRAQPCNDWLVNPYALSFLMTKLWLRGSKALLMSVDRMVTNSFLSIACKRKELVEKVRFCIPLRQIYFHSFIMIISIIILISNFHPRAPHCTTMHGNTEGQANITIGY